MYWQHRAANRGSIKGSWCGYCKLLCGTTATVCETRRQWSYHAISSSCGGCTGSYTLPLHHGTDIGSARHDVAMIDVCVMSKGLSCRSSCRD